jgi:zinc finger CCHC domain-containing protein 9
MTRITDFGRKRTYVEAGFTAQPELDEPVPTPGASSSIPAPITQQVSEAPSGAPPAKKKRKRTPKSKRDNYGKDKLVAETALAASTGEDGADAAAPASEGNEGEKETAEELSKRKLRKKAKTKEWREKSMRYL